MLLMEEKDILCPDCEINYITKEDYDKHGKCLSCRRRQNIMTIRGKTYIPKKLELVKEDNIIRIGSNKVSRKNIKYSQELHDLVKSLPDNTISDILQLIHKLLPEYKNLTELQLRSFMSNYKYSFVKLKDKEVVKHMNNKLYPKQSKGTIYTIEVMDYIYEIANENVSKAELLDLLKRKFPDKKLDLGNLNNIIKRQHIPYKQGTRGRQKNKVEDTYVEVSEQPIQLDTAKTLESVSVKFIHDNNISKHHIETTEQEDTEARLKDIEIEVDTILQTKYNEMNCNFDLKYTTDDYIKAFEILKFLMENKGKLFSMGSKQHDIINVYCRDTTHECESVLSKPGDTYFQDKLYVIRNRRRKLEHNAADLKIMYDFLCKADYKAISQILKDLLEAKEARKDPKFIPQVDYTMVDKYDWCVNGNKNVFDIYDKPGSYIDNTKIPESRKRVCNKYKASCYLSGAGFGTFKLWTKDYEAASEAIARSYAENDLDQLRTNNKGVLITSFQVVKINN